MAIYIISLVPMTSKLRGKRAFITPDDNFTEDPREAQQFDSYNDAFSCVVCDAEEVWAFDPKTGKAEPYNQTNDAPNQPE